MPYFFCIFASSNPIKMKQLCINYKKCDSIEADICLPASKSIANRALVVASLGDFVELLDNLSDCDDTHAVINALSSKTTTPNIGAAGTAMRFLTAYYAQKAGEWQLSGSERMHQRPIGILVEALRLLGADITYMGKEGFPPLCINGKRLQGGEISLSGGVSSQYISALLMIAPLMQNGLVLHLTDKVVSIPYIQMTLSMMNYFGVESTFDGRTIQIAPQLYQPARFVVENDWSAASYWYAVVALHPNATIRLSYLLKDSWQGDAKVASLFEPLGVKTTFNEKGIEIRRVSGPQLSYYDCDLSDQPDLAQTLVVVCLLLGVPFKFSGLSNLKIKETDRIAALVTECRKMGFVLQEEAEGVLVWKGEKVSAVQPICIDTYEDHRMAMAFAPAALVLGRICINNPMVVTKSYPQFWEEFSKIITFVQ